MNSAAAPTFIALIIQVALGLVVFQANRQRLANQSYLLLSLTITAWLATLYLVFVAATPSAAEFSIRLASVAGALVLTSLNLLRLSIAGKNRGWRDVLYDSRIWLIAATGIAVLSSTKWFLKAAQIPLATGGAPVAIYDNRVTPAPAGSYFSGCPQPIPADWMNVAPASVVDRRDETAQASSHLSDWCQLWSGLSTEE